jgi:hypothetical protein
MHYVNLFPDHPNRMTTLTHQFFTSQIRTTYMIYIICKRKKRCESLTCSCRHALSQSHTTSSSPSTPWGRLVGDGRSRRGGEQHQRRTEKDGAREEPGGISGGRSRRLGRRHQGRTESERKRAASTENGTSVEACGISGGWSQRGGARHQRRPVACLR